MGPTHRGRIRNLLRFIIRPGTATLAELHGALERWEEQVGKYCNSKDAHGAACALPEDIRMPTLESLVPAEMEAHLQMNASKFDTYAKMINEIVAYLESRTGARMRESRITKHDASRDAMDVGSMVKTSGKGSGGDQHRHRGVEKFSGTCNVCGKTGHKAAECWHAQSKGKKGGSGKGKSIPSRTTQGTLG